MHAERTEAHRGPCDLALQSSARIANRARPPSSPIPLLNPNHRNLASANRRLTVRRCVSPNRHPCTRSVHTPRRAPPTCRPPGQSNCNACNLDLRGPQSQIPAANFRDNNLDPYRFDATSPMCPVCSLLPRCRALHRSKARAGVTHAKCSLDRPTRLLAGNPPSNTLHGFLRAGNPPFHTLWALHRAGYPPIPSGQQVKWRVTRPFFGRFSNSTAGDPPCGRLRGFVRAGYPPLGPMNKPF